MARLPRYVIPGQPQHIIQRGNNRQVIFAADADFQFFRDAMAEASGRFGLAIHAYVWMTNHIHLLATATFNGADAQLDAAIHYLNEKIAKEPVKPPVVPAFPVINRKQ